MSKCSQISLASRSNAICNCRDDSPEHERNCPVCFAGDQNKALRQAIQRKLDILSKQLDSLRTEIVKGHIRLSKMRGDCRKERKLAMAVLGPNFENVSKLGMAKISKLVAADEASLRIIQVETNRVAQMTKRFEQMTNRFRQLAGCAALQV